MTAFRVSSRERRIFIGAVSLVVLGISLMVALGRPSGEEIRVRWAAKHVGPAYLWLCLLAAVAWDSFWCAIVTIRGRLIFFQCTVSSLIIFVAAQTAFGMLGMGVEFRPFGYAAEIRDARRRRSAIDELEKDLIRELPRPANGIATIPTLDGPYIAARFPSLFVYNLSRYSPFFEIGGSNVKLVRNQAMQVGAGDAVETVARLRDAVSPEFKAALATRQTLRDFISRRSAWKNPLFGRRPKVSALASVLSRALQLRQEWI